MANARSGNMHYVDATGVLTAAKNVKVTGILLTATAANAVLVLADEAGTTTLADLRVATSGETKYFDFMGSPLLFANGVKVTTLTNAKATLMFTNSAGGSF